MILGRGNPRAQQATGTSASSERMRNLYSITKGPQAIHEFTRAVRDRSRQIASPRTDELYAFRSNGSGAVHLAWGLFGAAAPSEGRRNF